MLGTAGHIDHGKTALIGRLTGEDTDRLAEEKRRGISIELGYAALDLPSGRRLSVVDVPGHERLVRTMVAGVTGVDLVLFCIAADDGVMPQTREHAAVLRALHVDRGVIAITKSDLASPDRAIAQARELLPAFEIVGVSSVSGIGLDALIAALERAVLPLPGRATDHGPARLHVDRSFTVNGVGTVVTGTLWAGAVAVGDTVTVLPRGHAARVRSIEIHNEPVAAASAGQRVALNLTGIRRRDVERGDVLCHPGSALEPTYRIDAVVTLDGTCRSLKRGARVQIHHGTREAPARVVPLAAGGVPGRSPCTPTCETDPGIETYCQLRLEAPLIPLAGDRIVLRQLAPPDTIGGGNVIVPNPRKYGTFDALINHLQGGESDRAQPRTGLRPEWSCADALVLDDATQRLVALLRSDAERPRADVQLAEAADLDPRSARQRLRVLERVGQAVRVGRNLHFHPEPLERLAAQVVAICHRDGATTVARVRDELNTTRRYAQAILEHLDSTGVTVRKGDEHRLRGRS